MPIARSTQVGQYRVISLVGAGGMGEVYRVEEANTSRIWALKTLLHATEGSELWRRFMNEGQIHSRLDHAGIAAFRDMFLFGNQPCLVMEYVDGETVADGLARGGCFEAREAARVLAELAEVLTYLHSKGIVHRDLKSSNIKINSAGRVKLLDFGIARMEGGQRLTRAGAVMGTPETLAPELLDGRPAGLRTEIWGLGVLGYEMLTGRMPFAGATDEALYEAVRSQDPIPPSRINPRVTVQLERVILRCLEKNPRKRYESSAALRSALKSSSGTGATSALAVHWRDWPVRPSKRTMIIAAVVLFLIVAYLFRGDTGGADSQMVTIESADGPASVYARGELVGKTPYRMRAHLGDSVQLELRRPGYEDQQVQFDVTERKVYSYTMQRSGR